MILLLLGVALWIGAHFLKRLAPGLRASMGTRGRGIIAILIFASIALMIVGYKMAEPSPLFTPPSWAIHANNLAMLFAVALMGLGSSKGKMKSWLRHPMLTGTAVWSLAHILVNGDLPSLILLSLIHI